MNVKQDKQGNWFKRHKILTGILIFIACFALVGAVSNGNQQNSTSQPPSTEKPTQSTETASAPEASKTWQKVADLSGDASKRSAPFALNGGQARMKYTVNGASSDSGLVAFYVMEEGKDLQKDGGFPEVTATKSGSDETQLTKSAGSYFIDVNAANASWTVTIEELK